MAEVLIILYYLAPGVVLFGLAALAMGRSWPVRWVLQALAAFWALPLIWVTLLSWWQR